MKKATHLLLLAGIIACSSLFSCQQDPPEADDIVVFSVDKTIDNLQSMADFETIFPGLEGKIVDIADENSLYTITRSWNGKSFSFYYLYKKSQGKRIDLRTARDFLYVNGQLHSAILRKESQGDFLQWLKTASQEDMKAFCMLEIVTDSLGELTEPLTKLVETNPLVNVLIYPDSTDFIGLFSATTPEFILLQEDEIHYWKNVKLNRVSSLFLFYSENDSLLLALTSSNLPALKQIMIGVDPEDMDGIGFLNRFPELESISILSPEDTIRSISFIQPFKNLKKLCLLYSQTEDLQPLDSLAHLSSLTLIAPSDSVQIRGMEHIRNLTYLEVPGASQEDLETIIGQNPDLIFLDISQSVITNLQPLTRATNLRGVVLPSLPALNELDLQPLGSLPNLKYIGISKMDTKDQEEQAVLQGKWDELRILCPDCITFQKSSGFCLGAGWILLFIPILALFLFYKKSLPRG